MIQFILHLNYQLYQDRHFGFEAAAWYWHFVDVVWILVFLVVYWWGS
jgi:heme/copper-type cytochrome/quinol oxidase subunit 3